MVLAGNCGDKHGDDSEAVVDYNGNPADKSRTGGWLAAGLILGTEFAERVCVMGISMNLVTYLVGYLHLTSSKSATIVTNFMGTLNLLGLFGGFVADAKLGRYLTVAIFASIAALGVALLTLATSLPSMIPPPCTNFRAHDNDCIKANGKQLAMLYAALYIIALGGGGIKSNVSGFGTDQFDPSNPKEEKAMIYFFNRFYFCISIGSLFAVTVLVYVQDDVGRGWGYGISAATMMIGVIVLLAGTRLYRYRSPQGSPLTIIWRVLFLAFKKRKLPHPSEPSFLNGYQTAKIPYSPMFMRCLDKAAILDDFASKDENRYNPWIVSTMTEVEEVKMVIKLFPIWSTCILFWTVYSQMTTFTIEQATFMNRKVGSFDIPAGSFSVFLFISILLFTSLNERLFVPIARRLTNNPQGLTSLQRVGVGLVSAMAAMISAAIVERQRRHKALHGVKLSAFWLVPQFFFVGAGEGFAYVGQLEFFIREAPEKMKSMSTGFFLSTLAMGFFVSSLLVSIVDITSSDTWLKGNLNKGKLDDFYWLLAALVALDFAVFVLFAMKHQYKVRQHIEVQLSENDEKELQSLEKGNGVA